MDNQIKTSFIPRKPLVTGKSDSYIASPSSRKINFARTFFSFISTLIFIASLALIVFGVSSDPCRLLASWPDLLMLSLGL